MCMYILCQKLVKSKKVFAPGEDWCDKLLQAASDRWERCDYGNIDVIDILKHLNCAGNWFKPTSKIFYRPFQGGTSFADHSCYFCHAFVRVCLLLPCGHLLGKG